MGVHRRIDVKRVAGLFDSGEKNLAEIGRVVGCSRERVRQILRDSGRLVARWRERDRKASEARIEAFLNKIHLFKTEQELIEEFPFLKE